ncbi:MAG TPA: DUF4920 domain-containing protein [Flavobacteriales bacterium]|nr:DUF4920 domain-containing protein [Flavobacteriales bacterium]
MNKLFYFLIPATLLISCGGDKKATEENTEATDTTAMEGMYKAGDEITEDGAMDNQQLLEAMLGKDSMEVKLTAKVNSVCQAKGCWMRLDMGEKSNELMVKFKDYAFFVPKDVAGKNATVQGWIKVDTMSVADQKHYAEDAGKSKEEIEKITEPKVELTFEANGVLIK